MSDDTQRLIEELRAHPWAAHDDLRRQAADALEAMQKENERLKYDKLCMESGSKAKDKRIAAFVTNLNYYAATYDKQKAANEKLVARAAELESALRGATEHLRECGTEFASVGNHIMQAGCYAMADQIEDAVLKGDNDE